MIYSRRLAIEARLRATREIEITLKGHCMEPLLLEGDAVKVAPLSRVSSGDICLVALPDGQIALHRILSVRNSTVFAKGDFSGKKDVLDREAVIGIATELKPRDCALWISLNEGFASRRVSAFLSNRLSKRCSTKGAMLLARLTRRIVWRRNAHRRRKMEDASLKANVGCRS